jgi:hypothetical protein
LFVYAHDQAEPSRKEEIERVKREQWENERKKNSNLLVPKYAGCVWNNVANEELKKHKIVPLMVLPILLEKDKTAAEDELTVKSVKQQKPTAESASWCFFSMCLA